MWQRKKWVTALSACGLLLTPSASSATTQSSLWDIINQSSDRFTQLLLISGDVGNLDRCGNGRPFYTIFVPNDLAIDRYLKKTKMKISDVAAMPQIADALVSDHAVNGWLEPSEMEDPLVPFYVAWSGRKLIKTNENTAFSPQLFVNLGINKQLIEGYTSACNGAVYFLINDMYQDGDVKVPAGVTVDPLNAQGAPRGKVRPERPPGYVPFAIEGELPDTN